MDDETREHLESLHKTVGLLTENLNFMLAMDQRTLLILARLAYVLERTSNKTFDLEELPDEPVPDRIEKAFTEIREYFEEQKEILGGKREWSDDD